MGRSATDRDRVREASKCMRGGVDPSSQADAQALGQATKHDWKLSKREILDIAGQGQYWSG